MVQSQFSLSWDSHKSSLCNGFSALQQNGEFVDMTIAADGHLVKVHQMMIALASPYLKELITSAPCQHPVIFLNNVSHKTLCSLLEYIYTGEVLLPSESLAVFVETAKALHIKGLESMGGKTKNVSDRRYLTPEPKVRAINMRSEAFFITSRGKNEILRLPLAKKHSYNLELSSYQMSSKSVQCFKLNSSECIPVRMGMNISHLETQEFKNLMTSPVVKTEQQITPPVTRKIVLKADSNTTPPKVVKPRSTVPTSDVMSEFSVVDEPEHDSDDGHHFGNQTMPLESHASSILETSTEKLSSNLQFTVSIRGSLQVILNRYIYNLHSVTNRTGVRRWRCVDYRNHKCMAYVVSKNNVVLNRGNLHNHPFHDKKILSKIEKNAVYSAIDDVEGYKDKESTEDTVKDDSTMDHDGHYLSLDFGEDS